MSSDYDVTYIPRQFRIRAEFSRDFALSSPKPPPEIMVRVISHLEQEEVQGKIAFYRFFETRWESVWEAMRRSDEPGSTRVAVTLASGAPPSPGINVDISEKEEELGKLTITMDPADLANIHFQTFKLIIGHKLRNNGITKVCDPAQLHGIWHRRCKGEVVKGVTLYGLPKMKSEKKYEVRLDPRFGGIELVIYDSSVLHSMDDELLLAQVVRVCRESSQASGIYYRILKHHLLRTFASALRGPERYGIDTPIVLLAAVVKEGQDIRKSGRKLFAVRRPKVKKSPKMLRKAKVASPKVEAAPKRPRVSLEITEDRLHVTIGSYDKSVYDHELCQTVEYWRKLLESKGIVYGYCDADFMPLIDLISVRGDITDFVLADGDVPIKFAEPYLHHSYLDQVQSGLAFNDRIMSEIVMEGDLICEFKFHCEGADGMDVYGKPIPPPDPELPLVNLGAGVISSDGVRFRAGVTGKPEIDGLEIGLSEILVVEGNVDSASGGIVFNGDVLVKGYIDMGSRIEVKGDLIVKGSIVDSEVYIEGKLKCSEGIINCSHRLISKSDIEVGFIENARIFSRGDIVVKGGIVGSEVRSLGSITQLDSSGALLGSQVFAYKRIECQNLGKVGGAATHICVGLDPFHSFRSNILSQRLARLKGALEKSGDEDQRKRLHKIVQQVTRIIKLNATRYKTDKTADIVVKSVMSGRVTVQVGNDLLKHNHTKVMATRIARRGNSIEMLPLKKGRNKAS